MHKSNQLVESLLFERYNNKLLLEKEDLGSGDPGEKTVLAPKKVSASRKKFEDAVAAEQARATEENKKLGLPATNEHQARLAVLYKTPGMAAELSPKEYEKLVGSTSKPLYIEKVGSGFAHSSEGAKQEDDMLQGPTEGGGNVGGKEARPSKMITPAHLSYDNKGSIERTAQAAWEHITDTDKVRQDVALGILTGGLGRAIPGLAGMVANKAGQLAASKAAGVAAQAVTQTAAKAATNVALAGTMGYMTAKDIEAGAKEEEKGKAVGSLEKTTGSFIGSLPGFSVGAKITGSKLPGETAGRVRAGYEAPLPPTPQPVSSKRTGQYTEFVSPKFKKWIGAAALAAQLAAGTPEASKPFSVEPASTKISFVEPSSSGARVSEIANKLTGETARTAEAPTKTAPAETKVISSAETKATKEASTSGGSKSAQDAVSKGKEVPEVKATQQAPAQIKQEAPSQVKQEAPAKVKDEAPAQVKQEAPAKVKDETPAKVEDKITDKNNTSEKVKDEVTSKAKTKKPFEEIENAKIPLNGGGVGKKVADLGLFKATGSDVQGQVGLSRSQLGRYSTILQQR